MTPMRDQVAWKKAFAFTLVLLLALSMTSCLVKTETEDDNATNTFLLITSITSEQGNASGAPTAGTDLFSDVCDTTNNPDVCQVFNDNGVVTIASQPKDQTQLATGVNDIVFERYRVTYIRSDGRNVPGVDVPYPFDGVTSFRVPINSEVSRTFMVVRQQAKLESPLIELSEFGGALVLSTLAQIDFYGRDVSGREIKLTGYLNVTFADF